MKAFIQGNQAQKSSFGLIEGRYTQPRGFARNPTVEPSRLNAIEGQPNRSLVFASISVMPPVLSVYKNGGTYGERNFASERAAWTCMLRFTFTRFAPIPKSCERVDTLTDRNVPGTFPPGHFEGMRLYTFKH